MLRVHVEERLVDVRLLLQARRGSRCRAFVRRRIERRRDVGVVAHFGEHDRLAGVARAQRLEVGGEDVLPLRFELGHRHHAARRCICERVVRAQAHDVEREVVEHLFGPGRGTPVRVRPVVDLGILVVRQRAAVDGRTASTMDCSCVRKWLV